MTGARVPAPTINRMQYEGQTLMDTGDNMLEILATVQNGVLQNDTGNWRPIPDPRIMYRQD